MRNLKLLPVGVVAAIVMCAAPSLLRAAISLGPLATTTPVPSTPTDWSGSLSFPEFNPTLGTLTRVALQFSSSLATTWSITNSGTSASTGYAFTEVQVGLSAPGLPITVLPQLDLTSPRFTFWRLPAGQNVDSGLLTMSQTSPLYDYTSANILSEFTGWGTVVLSATTLSVTTVGYSGGNAKGKQVTDAGLTGTVEYDYDAADVRPPLAPLDPSDPSDPPASPEPSTFTIFGCGALVLLGYLLRRKRTG